MRRLFFRFYLGVILILLVAWVIQAVVFRGTTGAANVTVIEDALGGGALLARDDMVAGGQLNYLVTLQEVQSRFVYPVNIVSRSDRNLSPLASERLDHGDAIFHWGNIDVAIPETDLMIEFGPLPQFAGPSQKNILIGLGSVFLLVAGAIAILLQPVARQLRTVERAALAIAAGDLSARIDDGKRRRGLPIVGAFNTMAERVELVLQSQKNLLQAVSHELRTPLARIKFAVELVRSSENDSKREQRLDAIDAATDNLDELVGELLDYARHDDGCESSAHELVDVNDLISETIAVYAPLHASIAFDWRQPATPIEIATYQAGLSRAVGNLVSNAGKYATSHVVVRAANDDGVLSITVEDDGNGIAEPDRDTVFEPFIRLGGNSAHGDPPPGTGLGLALVQRICRRLRGEVTLDQSPLGGARFTIRLPNAT